jgi:hypothetical protein
MYYKVSILSIHEFGVKAIEGQLAAGSRQILKLVDQEDSNFAQDDNIFRMHIFHQTAGNPISTVNSP